MYVRDSRYYQLVASSVWHAGRIKKTQDPLRALRAPRDVRPWPAVLPAGCDV